MLEREERIEAARVWVVRKGRRKVGIDEEEVVAGCVERVRREASGLNGSRGGMRAVCAQSAAAVLVWFEMRAMLKLRRCGIEKVESRGLRQGFGLRTRLKILGATHLKYDWKSRFVVYNFPLTFSRAHMRQTQLVSCVPGKCARRMHDRCRHTSKP